MCEQRKSYNFRIKKKKPYDWLDTLCRATREKYSPRSVENRLYVHTVVSRRWQNVDCTDRRPGDKFETRKITRFDETAARKRFVESQLIEENQSSTTTRGTETVKF